MAQHTVVRVRAGQWSQLTNADATNVTFQNRGPYEVYVAATTSAVEPTDTLTALRYEPGQGERKVAITDLFPGLAAADRLWAFCEAECEVFISHA